jgi:hypothetical protein
MGDSHELSSIDWDIALYVQELGFEPQTLHLSTRLPTKKNKLAWELHENY